jgi:hypothetical protein
MAKFETNDVLEAWKLNQTFNHYGEEADIGNVSPSTIGETYCCTDSGKVIMSDNGTDWNVLLFTWVAYP